MTTRSIVSLFGLMSIAFVTSGSTCGGGDDACTAAKKHMCEKIPDMNCFAAFMDNARNKIIDACGRAELDAYVPSLQYACNTAKASGASMNCGDVAGKTYASTSSDGGGGTCDAGAPMTFNYSGTATADGRAAQLSFTIKGNAVTDGSLTASSVCTSSVHLNRTSVTFTGSLDGAWEAASGVIIATWVGGDYACDGSLLTPDMGYPTSGALTISMANGKVSLQRIIRSAEPYEFAASGRLYTPATCP